MQNTIYSKNNVKSTPIPKRLAFSLLFLILILVVPWLAFSFENSSLHAKVLKTYLMNISDKEIIVIEKFQVPGQDNLKSCRLSSIRKKGPKEWGVAQSMDLREAGVDRIPVHIAFNQDWLAIACQHEISTYGKCHLFKKQDDQWHYVTAIGENLKCFVLGKYSLAITEDNILLFNGWLSEITDDDGGRVYSYDLKESPPKLIQTISPPKSILHGQHGVFGCDITVHKETLVMIDSAAGFSPEDIKRFHITKKDLRNRSFINDVPQPHGRDTVLTYVRQGNQWSFDEDLYYKLPHPAHGIIRDEDENPILFLSSSHVLVYPKSKSYTLLDNRLYLRGPTEYYIFEKSADGHWNYKKRIKPPFKLIDSVDTNYPGGGRARRYDIERIVLGKPYTARILPGYQNVVLYETEKLEDWKPLWSLEASKEVANEWPAKIATEIDIRDNVLVVRYKSYSGDMKEWYQGNDTIKIYEIDAEQGPQEVFAMQSDGENGILESIHFPH